MASLLDTIKEACRGGRVQESRSRMRGSNPITMSEVKGQEITTKLKILKHVSL